MSLIQKIQSKQAKIGIIGLGYVGLPLVLEFSKSGFAVTGFDIDIKKIESLKTGKSYIKHIDDQKIKLALNAFSPTDDFTKISGMDCLIICVPTPLNKHREPDMSYVFSTGSIIAQHIRRGQIVILESTTYPGTTDEDLRKILEVRGLKAGVDFNLAFSPEREDPNNKIYTTAAIPKVVGGYTPQCLKVATLLYGCIIEKIVPVSSTRVAEACKLLENIYRAVNIALVNELKMLFHHMNIDIWEVIDAAKTKPFGFHAFYPGPGLGGHCIPIDPFYLTWKAREYDFSTRFIELAGEINTRMPFYVTERVATVLNMHRQMSLKGSNILILGIAYKKDVDDMRESPALKIMQLLSAGGAEVSYSDPYVTMHATESCHPGVPFAAVDLTEKTLNQADLVLLLTDHSIYDYSFIERNASCIVDTRGVFRRCGIWSNKVHFA